jgi:hypothetical protein
MENMLIKIYNDGKERHQSFEAWCDELEEVDRGYGSTEEEAIAEYGRLLNNYHNKLVRAYRSFSREVVETQNVGYNGNAI